jgi:gliding motility-associated-like protein
MKPIYFFILFILFIHFADAQIIQSDFVLNGNATKIGDSCFRLTQERGTDGGSIWFKNRINLNFDFEVKASINLGRLDAPGADGIAFVLQPLSSTIGGLGGGLGYQGVAPSLAVEFDTWQNDDPPYDHIALVKNGNLSHYSSPSFTLQGPVEMLPNQANAEDDQYREVQFVWDSKAKRFRAYYNKVLKIDYTGDIINTIFDGNPYVYWGFTAATGGAINNQSVCLAGYNVIKEFECPTKAITGTSQVCQGDSIRVSVSDGLTFSWTGPNNFSSTQKSFSIPNATQLNSGKYTVITTDTCKKKDTLSFEVLVKPKPVIPVQTQAICSGEAFSLTPVNNPPTTVIPANTTYTWIVAANTNVSGQSNQTSPQISISQILTNFTNQVQEVVYTVTPSSDTQGGCVVNTFTVTITVNPKPSINQQTLTSCGGTAFSLTPTNGNGNIVPNNTSYRWSTPGVTNGITGVSSGNGTSITGNLKNSTNQQQIATYSVTPSSGSCNGSPFTIIATINPIPLVIAGNDTAIFYGDQIQLDIKTSIDVKKIQWTPSTYLSCTNCPKPISFPKDKVNYAIAVLNDFGCEARDSIKIELRCTEKNYFIPNTFSPNNDGINDVFYPRGEYIQKVNFLRVFNRWGELVFEQENFSINDKSKGWNGTFKGEKLNKGVFAYAAQLICGDGQSIELKGSIMILQ